MLTRMTKTTGATGAFIEFFNVFKAYLSDRHKNHLRDSFTDADAECCISSIPAGNKNLTLIVRVNQADQITENNAVFMAKARAG